MTTAWTLSAFCHHQLLTDGTLPLEALVDRAVKAGVTRARNPEASVKAALRQVATLLPGQRWALPASLLEGRVLTTRDFTSCDLRLLLPGPAASLPFASGGELPLRRFSDELDVPEHVRTLTAMGADLVAVRVRDGVLHAAPLARTDDLLSRGAALAASLGEDPSWGYDLVTRQNRALLARVDSDPAVFVEPLPPLSECVPSFAALLRQERESLRRQEQQAWVSACWSTIDLGGQLMDRVEDEAFRLGLGAQEWVRRLVERELYGSVAFTSDAGQVTSGVPPHRVGLL